MQNGPKREGKPKKNLGFADPKTTNFVRFWPISVQFSSHSTSWHGHAHVSRAQRRMRIACEMHACMMHAVGARAAGRAAADATALAVLLHVHA